MPCLSCEPKVGMGGLGQVDPITLAAIGEAVVNAKNLWANIRQIFGIGAGAREADAITPLQNQITQTILVPVSAFLTDVNNNVVDPTCSELQTWLSQVTQAESKWLAFLHGEQWQDGRAAQQAEATLAPYFTNAKTDLQKYIQQCGIGGGIITNPDGSMNWPVIGIGAGLVYMLTRRKG